MMKAVDLLICTQLFLPLQPFLYSPLMIKCAKWINKNDRRRWLERVGIFHHLNASSLPIVPQWFFLPGLQARSLSSLPNTFWCTVLLPAGYVPLPWRDGAMGQPLPAGQRSLPNIMHMDGLMSIMLLLEMQKKGALYEELTYIFLTMNNALVWKEASPKDMHQGVFARKNNG